MNLKPIILVGHGKFNSRISKIREGMRSKYRIILLAPVLRLSGICLVAGNAPGNLLYYVMRRHRIIVSDIYHTKSSLQILLRYLHMVVGSYYVGTRNINSLVINQTSSGGISFDSRDMSIIQMLAN